MPPKTTFFPPEILENKVYNGTQSDVFSLGVILFKIVLGKYPFQLAAETDSKYKLIMDNNSGQFWEETLT